MSTIRVFLADEQTLLREGLKRVLTRNVRLEVVGEAGDGLEAVAAILATKPDVVLLEAALPRLSGAGVVHRVLKNLPDTKVLVLSMYASPEYILQTLEAGVLGYVLKDAPMEDLVRAIEIVHDGIPFFSPAVSKVVVDGYLRRYKEKAPRSLAAYNQLTQREREILQLVAEGHRSREISELLDLSIKTVEVHRAHIMEKLGARTLGDLVRVAVGSGIIR